MGPGLEFIEIVALKPWRVDITAISMDALRLKVLALLHAVAD